MAKRYRPADITALSLLFVLAALLCVVCGLGLMLPAAEPHPYLRMLPALAIMGTEAVSWLVFFGIACVAAALGLWRCAYWGFMTALAVVVLFLAMHFLRALYSQSWQMLVILAVGALAGWYLRKRMPVFVHPVVVSNTPGAGGASQIGGN
ncbi:MAG TPA: hypothetical protein VGL00_19120 [Terracidiphilus sp.]|jgi:uncharacterized membrane protein (UPF0136 family)